MHTSDSGKPHAVDSLHPKTTPYSQCPTTVQLIFLRLGTVVGADVNNMYQLHFNKLKLQDHDAHQPLMSGMKTELYISNSHFKYALFC